MAIKQPFGTDLNSNFYGGLDSIGTITSGVKALLTVDSMFSFVNSGSAASEPKKLSLTIDDDLPAGAILVVYHDASPSGSELALGTGFATAAKTGLRRIGMTTTLDGTGTWQATFIYNGTEFIPIGLINLSGTSKLAK